MGKERTHQTVVIVVLAVAVLLMSVGFATFAAKTIDLNGTVTAKKSNWDVHLKTDSYVESTNSIEVATANRTITTTSMTYSVTLTKPGDFYEFTVTAENGGTFDAALKSITMSTLTAAQQKYISYKVYYNGTEYTTTTTEITGVTLASGATAPVKVRVEYLLPASESDLPTTGDSVLTLNATLSFEAIS